MICMHIKPLVSKDGQNKNDTFLKKNCLTSSPQRRSKWKLGKYTDMYIKLRFFNGACFKNEVIFAQRWLTSQWPQWGPKIYLRWSKMMCFIHINLSLKYIYQIISKIKSFLKKAVFLIMTSYWTPLPMMMTVRGQKWKLGKYFNKYIELQVLNRET